MRKFLLRRLIRAVVALWGISTIVFVVMRLSGDPVPLMLPPDAPRSEIERVRSQLGLDQPIYVQYLVYFRDLLQGNLGRSIHMRQPAMQIAAERLPATLELAIGSFVLAVVIAVPAGLVSAARRNSIWDNLAMGLALLGQSAPTFYIGIMLILVMGLQLGWFPISGRGQGTWLEPTDWPTMLRHMVLPAVTLGAFAMASIARLTRSAVLETMRQDFIRTARAKGLNEARVLVRHNLKNAAIPIITIMGLQFGTLLGGAVVTETVFSWPGIGRLAIQSIFNRDYPVVQSSVLLVATFFVLVNFLVDLTYGWLDPRIRYS
jgi:ABC-type dipeptide/oligopeptide/nickel transport system permease component